MILRRVAAPGPLGRRRLRAAAAAAAGSTLLLLLLLLLALLAGTARAYMLLPGGSRLPHSAKAWGSFRQRLGLGPRTARPAPGAGLLDGSSTAQQQARLVPPLRSATAPSPPKANSEAKAAPAPAPAELLMDELGDLELQVKTKIEVRACRRWC